MSQGLEILQREILPLFDQNRKNREIIQLEPNVLVSTGLNQYELYVNLNDVYTNQNQVHELAIPGNQKKKFKIPIAFHEIILSKKGFYQGNIDIQIKSLKHPDFIRVNSFDLVALVENNTNQLTHLNGDVIDLPGTQGWYRLNDLGLPKMDGSRGVLYVCVSDRTIDRQILMEILNYHQNSNVDLDQEHEVNLDEERGTIEEIQDLGEDEKEGDGERGDGEGDGERGDGERGDGEGDGDGDGEENND